MMFALAVIAVVLCAGALVTLGGSRLIARLHPPRGRFVDIDGCRQHIVELNGRVDAGAGDPGPPIVLLHGAGSNLEDMRLALGERLAGHCRVILIDRPGQGWSTRSGRDSGSPAYQASVLREVLERLAIDRAIIVGHSWGGTLAATFALDHPERVAGLVLLAPPTHPQLRRLSRLYQVLGTPAFGWLFANTLALPLAAAALSPGLHAAFRPQQPPENYLKRAAGFLLLRPATFLANARDIAGLHAFLARQAARYGALRAPTIIVAGDRDGVVSPQQHAMILAASAPNAKLILLPGVGHMPHHAAPDRIVAAVEELLAKEMAG